MRNLIREHSPDRWARTHYVPYLQTGKRRGK
jgi:hypothetical protein